MFVSLRSLLHLPHVTKSTLQKKKMRFLSLTLSRDVTISSQNSKNNRISHSQLFKRFFNKLRNLLKSLQKVKQMIDTRMRIFESMQRIFAQPWVGWVNLDYVWGSAILRLVYRGYSFLVHQNFPLRMRNVVAMFAVLARSFMALQHGQCVRTWWGNKRPVYSGKLPSNGVFPNVFQFSFILNFTLNTPLYSVY